MGENPEYFVEDASSYPSDLTFDAEGSCGRNPTLLTMISEDRRCANVRALQLRLEGKKSRLVLVMKSEREILKHMQPMREELLRIMMLAELTDSDVERARYDESYRFTKRGLTECARICNEISMLEDKLSKHRFNHNMLDIEINELEREIGGQ